VTAGARMFRASLVMAAALVRRRRLAEPVRRAMGRVGDRRARRRGVGVEASPRAMAVAWQRAFPPGPDHPIVAVDETTAYAEIHTRCPLRGSGDTEACWRLMQYDRAFAARAGARFVVLESQATPGVTVCKVALRPAQLPADDLVPAHELARRR
jgi:hypothetical protein